MAEEDLLDVTDIAELLADNEFLEEDVGRIAAALAKGADMKEYAQEVEGELKEVESASIEAYIREDENLKNLHKDIRSCDGKDAARARSACLVRAGPVLAAAPARAAVPCSGRFPLTAVRAQRSWREWSTC
eukprot:COSAG06_NODE_14293_length_1169_cov_1.621495_1_plen_130_part_10